MGSSDRTWVVLDSLVTQANRVPGTATIAVRLSDELKRLDWAGVRGQSPLWRSPRPAEIGSAGRSSEDVGRKVGDRTPPKGSAFRWIYVQARAAARSVLVRTWVRSPPQGRGMSTGTSTPAAT